MISTITLYNIQADYHSNFNIIQTKLINQQMSKTNKFWTQSNYKLKKTILHFQKKKAW